MPDTQQHFLLNDLLRSVSRSFFLTLRVLPSGMREPISIAYLLARAADTIADTAVVLPEARLKLLTQLQSVIQQGKGSEQLQADLLGLIEHQEDSHERLLLQQLSPVVALLESLSVNDRKQVVAVVMTLISGMLWDIQYFPSESAAQVRAVAEDADLDRYTYMVAGCVGEFWSDISYAHDPRLKDWDLEQQRALGVRFGKALQLTNILRDLPADLRIGRCYLPQSALSELGLTAEALLEGENSARLRPLFHHWLTVAVDHYVAAQDYIRHIPRSCYLLRLACLWPVMIGLKTLQRLAVEERYLEPGVRVKITRGEVYHLMISSLPMVLSERMTDRWLSKNIKQTLNTLSELKVPQYPG